ncbi:MAG: hypothetical protein KBT47_04840 [Armatimonadetes bacterium]|nr:hypothetical protein [Candidatus Hippobium faecium]
MKIGFVAARNISHITSLRKYESVFEKYDLIYWNKLGLEESCGAENVYAFRREEKEMKGKKAKAKAYLDFRKFVCEILKKNRYDRLVVLPTQTAVLLWDVLLFGYRKKYLLDIRDYTGEHNPLFYALMKKLVMNAHTVSLTSPAFREFLPQRDYVVSHNYYPVPENLVKEFREKHRTKNSPVKLYCIGGARFPEYFRKVIDCFADDGRFEIGFVGTGSEKLADYVKEKNIKNVYLAGSFPAKETARIHASCDMESNLFGHNTPLLDYALSNRFYYAVTFGMPCVACKGTYTEKMATEGGFGFSFDETDPNIADRLWKYYENLDMDRLYEKCDAFMAGIKEDEEKFISALRRFAL